mmetsp:Transcript_65278/g.175143  ORF Transcript_65278/g.175143 Transcript_65278/m.175143 type:complete len:89 (+) Transcript_65278:135-401(+)
MRQVLTLQPPGGRWKGLSGQRLSATMLRADQGLLAGAPCCWRALLMKKFVTGALGGRDAADEHGWSGSECSEKGGVLCSETERRRPTE